MAEGKSKRAWDLIESHRRSSSDCTNRNDEDDVEEVADVDYADLVDGWKCLISPRSEVTEADFADVAFADLNMDSSSISLNTVESLAKENHENSICQSTNTDDTQPSSPDHEQPKHSAIKLFQLNPHDDAVRSSREETGNGVESDTDAELVEAAALIQSVEKDLVDQGGIDQLDDGSVQDAGKSCNTCCGVSNAQSLIVER